MGGAGDVPLACFLPSVFCFLSSAFQILGQGMHPLSQLIAGEGQEFFQAPTGVRGQGQDRLSRRLWLQDKKP